VGAKDSIASAMLWVGRGQSYPALCREIAWTDARATGTEHDDLEWLIALVDRRLGGHIDRLPPILRRVRAEAVREHLCLRPHDADGAELSAEHAGRDVAIEHLSTAYMDALDWSVGVLHERRRVQEGRARRWRRRSLAQAPDEPVQCEVAQRILDGLTWRSTQPGWRDRRAA
jgi:hypothetical protein